MTQIKDTLLQFSNAVIKDSKSRPIVGVFLLLIIFGSI